MNERVYIGVTAAPLEDADPEGALLAARVALGRIDAVFLGRSSGLYRCDRGRLHAVIELSCELSPARLLGILQHIERDLGRGGDGPAPIDLDILYWSGRLVAQANLQVPHLALHQRRAALEPLCELIPDERHPVLGVPLAHLLSRVTGQPLQRLGSTRWPLSPAEVQLHASNTLRLRRAPRDL